MILTDYYKFEKLPERKSKTRIDCTAATDSYYPLEVMRNEDCDLFVYLCENTYTKTGQERKADLALSRVKHISSIFCPDFERPYWYGDMNHTADAILFVHHGFSITNGAVSAGAIIEMFIARGQRQYSAGLYNRLCGGGFNDEMKCLRERATLE